MKECFKLLTNLHDNNEFMVTNPYIFVLIFQSRRSVTMRRTSRTVRTATSSVQRPTRKTRLTNVVVTTMNNAAAHSPTMREQRSELKLKMIVYCSQVFV